MAAEAIPAKGTDDLVALRSANDVLGGNMLSRLNASLRETKGWTYGVSSLFNDRRDRLIYRIDAPVQTDRTGDAVAEIRRLVTTFLTGKGGVKPDELGWTTANSARELPGMFETTGSVLEGMVRIISNDRPDDFYERLPDRYKTMTATQLDTAARNQIDPAKLTWIIVGDAAKVKPQLAKLGLPVERVAKLLKDRKISIDLSEAAKRWLGRVGYDPVYGARPLKRAVQRHLQDPLAEKLLRGEIPDGSTVHVDEGDGALVFAVS
jgi:hypothetical protein